MQEKENSRMKGILLAYKKERANTQAKSAIAHIAFLPVLGLNNLIENYN
jgi:hypothetical protein